MDLFIEKYPTWLSSTDDQGTTQKSGVLDILTNNHFEEVGRKNSSI